MNQNRVSVTLPKQHIGQESHEFRKILSYNSNILNQIKNILAS